MKLNSPAASLAAASLLLGTSTAAAQSNSQTRADVFDGVVKTVSEQFYDPAFHGVNWPAVEARYRARLDTVTNDSGLQQLIAQMLAELQSSHLYVYRTTPGVKGGLAAQFTPASE